MIPRIQLVIIVTIALLVGSAMGVSIDTGASVIALVATTVGGAVSNGVGATVTGVWVGMEVFVAVGGTVVGIISQQP